MVTILDLEPKSVWRHFDEIRKIPRCSKHEDKIREYILNFASKNGLEAKTDKAGNVLILKPASKGMEDKPIVVLQGHMDMVCEKNANVEHDFSKDPIKVKIENNKVKAEGTTLGADNGIGIAIMLSILEDKNLRHGPIEALFTVDEETGLTGAFAIEPDFLKGRIMLNLDSENFGVITIGSAGGGNTTIELPLMYKESRKNAIGLRIKVGGLKGGHSGVDIHEQRGNAIKILARLLWRLKGEIELASIKGGDKMNAIPRESEALVYVQDKEKFVSSIREIEGEIMEEIKPIDPGFKVEVEKITERKKVLERKSQDKLIDLLHALPHGVQRMSFDVPGLVETSTNLARVSIEDGKAIIGMSSRSAIKSALQDMKDKIRAVANLAGAEVKEDKPYPGWKPNPKSRILKIAKEVYREMFREEAKVEAIHAGLECGIIGEKFPGMDMISIGPTIKHPHSPDEYVEIDSVEKFYRYVLKILERV